MATLGRCIVLTAFAATFAVAIGAASWRADAELSNNSSRRNAPPIRIAIAAVVSNSQYDDVVRGIVEVITANLMRTGQFVLVDPGSAKKQVEDFNTRPPFDEYRSIDAQALVVVTLAGYAGDKISIAYRLWDISGGIHVVGGYYEIPSTMMKDQLADCISAAIQHNLTGTIGDVACH